jgi:hypothetical protein
MLMLLALPAPNALNDIKSRLKGLLKKKDKKVDGDKPATQTPTETKKPDATPTQTTAASEPAPAKPGECRYPASFVHIVFTQVF